MCPNGEAVGQDDGPACRIRVRVHLVVFPSSIERDSFYYAHEYFFSLLHASQTYATSVRCVRDFNFEAASRILSLCRAKKKKQIFISELCVIFLFYSWILCTHDRNPWHASNITSYRTVNSDLLRSILSGSSNILLTLSKRFSTSDSNYVDSLMYIVKLRITVC